jgi:hypothetical protein
MPLQLTSMMSAQETEKVVQQTECTGAVRALVQEAYLFWVTGIYTANKYQ